MTREAQAKGVRRLRAGFSAWLLGTALAIGLAGVATAAPPQAFGPAMPPAETAGGFVGSLAVSPAHGPAGAEVTVTGSGLPPGETFDLVWRTVEGRWLLEPGLYKGREFTPVGYRIAAVTAAADGTFAATFTTPEDFGFQHDITLQQGTRLLTQVGYSVDLTMKLTPESGPLGTAITVEVQGIGYKYLENSWTLVYDNGFTGWVSSITTQGAARFTIPATGAEGTHVLRLVHAGFTYPYLNPEQNPYPDRVRPRAEFVLTPGEPVLPRPPEQQLQAAVRSLPAPGDLAVTPAFSGIGVAAEVSAAGLTPGKTYALEWSTVVGNRISGNGWSTESRPIAEAVADAAGNVTFGFAVPDDLGGAHEVSLAEGEARRSGSLWITPTALPLDVTSGPAGTTLTVHIKGGGWSETANIYHVNYDNAYLGYACAFNSAGDITIYLSASGEPGWHFIDVYPGIYKGSETNPSNYRIPQLTYAADHPGEDLPAFHFAFRVTEPAQN